jgi:hypothetical protein
MRSTNEVSLIALNDRGRFREIQPERQRVKDPSPLKVKEVFVEDRRCVVCLNEEQRRKDAADREVIVAQLRERLPNRPLKNPGVRRVWARGLQELLRNRSLVGRVP